MCLSLVRADDLTDLQALLYNNRSPPPSSVDSMSPRPPDSPGGSSDNNYASDPGSPASEPRGVKVETLQRDDVTASPPGRVEQQTGVPRGRKNRRRPSLTAKRHYKNTTVTCLFFCIVFCAALFMPRILTLTLLRPQISRIYTYM